MSYKYCYHYYEIIFYLFCYSGSTYNLSEQEKAEADARSVYVGNVSKWISFSMT